MAEIRTETHAFQTEVNQLLHLMVHSLYSNKEIFLRELISNASDASDKLSFLALENSALYEGDGDLRITLKADKEARTLRIIDKGIGMNREEAIANLGTIARSGTSEFLKNLSGDQKKDSRLIGQFGVGFYSAFIVADRVEVFSRKAGEAADKAVYWASRGDGQFDLADIERAERGTEIVLHLREGEDEFLDAFRLQGLVRKYSDHIALPVYLEKPGDKEDEATTLEQVNKATALWTRNRSEISDEEYQDFYKHISHDFDNPLTWSHNRVEGKLDYTSLLYIPKNAPFDLYNRDQPHGLKLYVQRVFIMDDAEQFLPLYLRFAKGVIDSNDLSLNISREILQQDKTVSALKTALTKRVLDTLGKLADNQPEQYQQFWEQFGSVLKEGLGEDFSNRDTVAKLLRFASTDSGKAEQNVSLTAYKERMAESQKAIYYLVSDSHTNALGSPHLEIFKKKGIEVLLLSERIDEWAMGYLQKFDDLELVDIARGNLDLGDEADKADEKSADDSANNEVTDALKKVLSEEVEQVRISQRLVDSPACLVVGEDDMGLQMRRILEAAGQAVPASKPILEINLEHPLVKRLGSNAEDARFQELGWVLYEQARLASGEPLKDAAAYVRRINSLLLELPA